MNGTPFLYIDQYGNKKVASTVKELCESFGYSKGSARTMYQDKKDGKTVKCGYVIGPHWFTRFTWHEVEA